MEALVIESTDKTPFINFNPETGIFEICGRSITENPLAFYLPILNWLQEYILCPSPTTTLNIKLEYANTGSSVCLFDVFVIVEKLSGNKMDVQVRWMYEEGDEDILKLGEDIESITSLPIEYIPNISK